MKHEFGGLWTRKKLEILSEYLNFYAKALKNKHFSLHYADAFAGTGIQNQKVIEGQQDLISQEDFNGSVLTALEVAPGFNHYHFNDLDTEHVAALNEIKANHPTKNIHITEKDANIFVLDFCKYLRRGDRAVLFIDPYNTEFDWASLEVVAKTKKIDLWLLFPLSVILRMTPKHGSNIIPSWEATLNRLLGTCEWKEALYKAREQSLTLDLFDNPPSNISSERVNPDELQLWVKSRLEEVFSFVAKPVMLKNNNTPLFSFFFAVANPSEPAWGLAQKVANYIIKKHA